jgi:glutamine amidotransferase
MGWNTVEAAGAMFAGVAGERFYFVHSYAAKKVALDLPHVAWCTHEHDRFVAAVEAGHIWGTQFHPEKSGSAGARLLTNWLGFVGAVS